MILKILSILLFITTFTTFVIGESITSGMYGIRTLDYQFITPNGDDQHPIITAGDGGSDQIWFVLEDEKHPNQFYFQNIESKKYLHVQKDHIYLNPKKYTLFKIQNVKDDIYTIQLPNSKLQCIAKTNKKNKNTKDIVLSNTHSGTNNQFQFLMVLN